MKGISIALSIILLIVCFMLGNLYFTVNNEAEAILNEKTPKYHIQVLTQNSDEHFWETFKKGATSAGIDLNMYVEFVDVNKRDVDDSIKAVNRAIYAKVDGIALQANDIQNTSKALKEAAKNKLAVLTFENIYNIPNVVTVGSNSYDIGYKSGDMAAKACGGFGNIAVIVNDSGNEKNQYKNLKVQGIKESISKYPKLSISEVYSLEMGIFEIEKLTREILSKNPNINVIICTDERNTPGIAQVLVDSNKVGDIKVIGYGAMPQTLSYIQRGVIYGTVCPDAYQIGYNSVSQLKLILDGQNTSDSTNTDVYSVVADNVERYIKNKKE